MDTITFLSDFTLFLLFLSLLQSESLSLSESKSLSLSPFSSSKSSPSYCNIGPYRIHIPQSNLLDYKMSPCPIEIIVVFGKHSLPPAIGLFHGIRFFFLINCEYLAAFRLSGGSILNMQD